MSRLFGRAAESDLDRERREIDETQWRRGRDAWSEARARADAKEAERREATQAVQRELEEAGRARLEKMGWIKSEEAQAQRQEAARERLVAAEIAQRETAAFRRTVSDALSTAGGAVEAAFAGRDMDAYAAAHARSQAFRELLGRLDDDERTRRRIAGMPIIPGAAQI